MGDVVAGGERYTVGQVLVRLREEFGQEVTADQVHKAVWSPRVANSRASLVAQIPTPVRRDGASVSFAPQSVAEARASCRMRGSTKKIHAKKSLKFSSLSANERVRDS